MPSAGLARRELILTLAAGLASCAKPAGKPAVRIGFQRSGVLLLAKARHGLDAPLKDLASAVTWVEFPAGPPMMEAMAAGAIDLGAVGDSPPIFAQAAGAQIVYAAAQPVTGASEAVLVPSGSPARSVSDLRGKKIAFTKGSSAHLFTYRALKQAGLSLNDIKPVYLSPGDAAGAFGSGAIDAWTTWDPYYALAVRDQKARALLSGEAVAKTSTFYVATRRFAEGSPAVLSAALTALKAQAAWGMAHVADVAGVVSAASGLPQDIVTASLRRGVYAVDPIDDAVIATQQASADAFLEMGAIPKRVDVGAAVWKGWKA
jgi:sulfonate transport system substrate-binding protein